MQLKLVEKETWGDHHLNHDTLHLINFSKGILVFPNADRLCRVQILFTEPGEFLLNAGRANFQLGSFIGQYVSMQPGVPGFDMMPDFIFNPQKKIWHINTRGNFVFYDNNNKYDFDRFR